MRGSPMSCLGEERGHSGCGAADHAHQVPEGRRFTFFDPSGNRLIVWAQPRQDAASSGALRKNADPSAPPLGSLTDVRMPTRMRAIGRAADGSLKREPLQRTTGATKLTSFGPGPGIDAAGDVDF